MAFVHPVDVETLPEAARKVLKGPPPLKMMAARGMAPLPPPALLSVLYALAYDADEKLAEAAKGSLAKLPDTVLNGALGAPDLPAAVLDDVVNRLRDREGVIDRVLVHPALAIDTVLAIAKTANEELCELLATNEQRLLEHPALIEALYLNPRLRMSTADRICELAARNGVKPNIPGFDDIAAALQNQLIPEAGESTPSDDFFREALDEAEQELELLLAETAEGKVKEDDDLVERDEEGKETTKKRWKKVEKRLEDMNVSEQIRVALVGTAQQRSVLVRSPTRMVYMAAITSPKMQESEAVKISASRQVPDDVLRYIAGKRDWIRLYEVKRNLVMNPKTPMGIALQMLPHLRDNDVKGLAKSKNVSSALKTAATQLVAKRSGPPGGGAKK